MSSAILNRRQFLKSGAKKTVAVSLGAALASTGLSACGQSGPDPQLVALFSSNRVIVAGRPQRLPFGVIDQGQLVSDDTAEVSVKVKLDGDTISEHTVVGRIINHDHVSGAGEPGHQHSDILRYFALRTTLPSPGIYDLEVRIGGRTVELPIQAFDPSETTVVLAGDPFPKLVTPTDTNPAGVNPICTRLVEPCGLHSRSAAEILGSGQAMALLASTPQLCSTSYCGPVLEELIVVAAEFSNIAAVHVEVYENSAEVKFNLLDPALRPAKTMADLGLDFEPALFLVGSDGIVADRIDNLFDQAELREALAKLS